MITFCVFNLGTDFARDFLDPGFGARSLSMGSAFVAIADDATGFYWNPAGFVDGKTIGLMHAEDYDGCVKYNYGSFITGDGRSALGFALYNIRVGGIKFTELPDSTEEIGPENRPEVISTEMAADYVLYLNRVRKDGTVSYGGNLKLIYRDLVVVKGYGIGCDLGLLFKKSNLNIGLAIRDIVLSPIYYSSRRWEYLSPILAFGISGDIAFYGPGRLTPSIEFDKIFDEDISSFEGRIGLEYEFKNMVALRSGFKGSLFTLGIGVRYQKFILDYAFLPSHPLGSCHKISGGAVF